MRYRIIKILLSIVILFVIVGLVVIGVQIQKEKQMDGQILDYIKELDAISVEWDAANRIANNTGRGNLSPFVAKLQEIQIRVSNLEVPENEDAEEVNRLLVNYMDAVIDGYFAFMAEAEDDELKVLFALEDICLDEYVNAVVNLEFEHKK